MKKLLFVFAISTLLATGCNSTQQASVQAQIPVVQNTNSASAPTPPPATSNPYPLLSPSSSSTTTSNVMAPASYAWCMANGGVDKTPNYNAPKICILNNTEYEENCVGNNKYFIISQDSAEGAGTDILVKYKSAPDQFISCNYVKESGDLEVGGDGTYVLALENNFLLLDVGTGPDPRGLTIYDLNTRKEIYNDSYSKPVDVQGDIVDYWTESAIKVTEENCPDFKTWESDGLGAAIDEHVSLNLLTLAKTELGEYQCSPRQ